MMTENVDDLIKAIEHDDLSLVKQLSSTGVGANQHSLNCSQASPLSYAVAYGRLEIVQSLLAAGIHPHENVLLQIEPASDERTLTIMSLLIESGINLNFELEEADTLLMKAAARGELDFVKLLVESGANVNQINQNGESALLFAACAGWQDVYEYLALVTSPDLRVEAEKEILDGILRRQRTSNQLLNDFITAAAKGDVAAVQDVIKTGIDVNTIGAEGNTALYIAAYWGHISVVRTLIDAGADVNLGKENYGATPLIACVSNIATARYLGESNAETQQVEVARLLIEAGADVNATGSDGWQALTAAANAGSTEAVNLLLQADANINARDNLGHTPLYRAQQGRYSEIVQLLLNAGAIV